MQQPEPGQRRPSRFAKLWLPLILASPTIVLGLILVYSLVTQLAGCGLEKLQRISNPSEKVVPAGGTLLGPYERLGQWPSFEGGLAAYDQAGKHSVLVASLGTGSEVWLIDGQAHGPVLGTGGDLRRPEAGLDAAGRLWVALGEVCYNGYLNACGSLQPTSGKRDTMYEDYAPLLGKDGKTAGGCFLDMDRTLPRSGGGNCVPYWFAWKGKLYGPAASFWCGQRLSDGALVFGYHDAKDGKWYLRMGDEVKGPFATLEGPVLSEKQPQRIVYSYQEKVSGPAWVVDSGKRSGPFEVAPEVDLSADGKHLALIAKGGDRTTVWLDGKKLGVFGDVGHDGFIGERQSFVFSATEPGQTGSRVWVDGKPVARRPADGRYSGPFRGWEGQSRLAFGYRVEGSEQVGVWFEGKRYGPYEAVLGLGLPPGEGHVIYWATPPGTPWTYNNNLQDAFSREKWQLFVDGKLVGNYWRPGQMADVDALWPDYTQRNPAREWFNSTPKVLCEDATGQYVLVDGKPVGPFGYVVSAREESPSGPLAIFYVDKAEDAMKRPSGSYSSSDKPAPDHVWVAGQRYSLEQYQKQREIAGAVTFTVPGPEHSWPHPLRAVWIAGNKLGPVDDVLACTVSPDGKQALLAFIRENNTYLWQGPVGEAQ